MKFPLIDLVSVESHDESPLLGEDCEDGATLDLCRQIQAVDSETPILIGSAKVNPAYCKEGIRVGAQANLATPCELDEPGQTIKSLIVEALVKGSGNGVDYDGARKKVRHPRLCVVRLGPQSRMSVGHSYRGRSLRRVLRIRARSALEDRRRRVTTAGRRRSGDGR